MISIRTIELPESKYKIKCPNSMIPTRIVIHNTANDAKAEQEVRYMQNNNKECSFHFAVDDTEIVEGLPLSRNGWHSGDGNGKGNREGIAIEICYSKSGGERFKAAQDKAAQLTAYLLKNYGWDISRVTKHEDYAKKHCPHRTLDEYGWDFFLNLVKSYMTKKEEAKPIVQEVNNSAKDNQISVIYQVWDDVRNSWLTDVTDKNDYAGIFGHDVCLVYANLTQGNITYAVHVKGGKWLPEVTNREDFAGITNKPIDGIIMKTDTDKTLHYKAHLRRLNKWLPEVTGFDYKDDYNGYAGIIGQEIDAIQIWLD